MSAGKKIVVVVAVIAILAIAAYSLFAGNYNRFVQMDVAIKAAWSQVENQLQRRYDLIPNLVETVKGYAKHEKDVLVEVTNARSKVGGAGTVPDKIAANNELSGALSRLMVVVERYPDLKANQNFLKLQDELAGTENRIGIERMRYNEAVKVYNQAIRSFPANLVANMFGFKEAAFFESAKEAKTAPKVNF
ncbi:MAG: LemA family protein [Syntrophaceae bacterium]|nr:LemA family protein [Syntrophaceae bacterium]HOC59006.1 LemA family protein [Smithellaceae bacterium]HQM44914.1 LemA family protein [Smithellaceae bacterium]